MLGFAARQHVHVEVVVQGRRRCHRVVLMRRRQLRKGLVGLLVDHRTLFDPADLILLRLDLQESLAAFEHLQRLPVHHLGHAR